MTIEPLDMSEPNPCGSMELEPEWLFEVERNTRVIDGITDLETVKKLCKMFLQAWLVQKAAAKWATHEAMQHLTELQEVRVNGKHVQ